MIQYFNVQPFIATITGAAIVLLAAVLLLRFRINAAIVIISGGVLALAVLFLLSSK